MAEYKLELKGICKSFPGVKALDNVQLSVRPGTVHALMGENGAGKSTLMKCLFGIYKMDAGEIYLDGEKIEDKKLSSVSILIGENAYGNADEIVESIFKYLPQGPQYYDEDTVTDQPMRQIAAELIREKALRMMSDEIPHGIAVTIERMTERDNGIFDIDATIICERESHKGIVIGKGGQMLKRIGTSARIEIENLMDTKVNLKLWVKVRKEWRDSELYMKNYGYNSKDI